MLAQGGGESMLFDLKRKRGVPFDGGPSMWMSTLWFREGLLSVTLRDRRALLVRWSPENGLQELEVEPGLDIAAFAGSPAGVCLLVATGPADQVPAFSVRELVLPDEVP